MVSHTKQEGATGAGCGPRDEVIGGLLFGASSSDKSLVGSVWSGDEDGLAMTTQLRYLTVAPCIDERSLSWFGARVQ